MNTRKYSILFAVSLLAAVTMACAVSLDLGQPTTQPEGHIATSVAATLSSRSANEGQPTELPAPSPTFTVHPTVTASPPEPDIVYRGISFSFEPSVALSVNAEQIPGQGDPENPWSTPESIRFTFVGYPLGDTFHEPVIHVYSVDAFKAVNPDVGQRLDHLQGVLDSLPADPEVGVAHFFNAAQFIRAQEQYLQFQNGSGVRFISQYGQAAGPIGWPHLFYTFQGLTADGRYYVSAILPVTHPSLPEPDDVIMDEAFYDQFMDYAAEKEIQLDGEPADSFQPSLLILDEVMDSLRIELE